MAKVLKDFWVLIMTENEWTKKICDKLNKDLSTKSLNADTLVKIPYSQEITEYSYEWKPECFEPTRFETDLIIFEKTKNAIKPRVIIESKLGHITTHDAITYSYKAEKHKNITPFLRYGIMIGDRKDHPLPGRLFRHGTNFDFMFSFSTANPIEVEWDTFVSMITREVDYSRTIEEMLHESRNKERKHYYMMQKQLVFKEMV